MNLNYIGIFISLSFPPLFILSLKYYSFEQVSFIFFILITIYLFVTLVVKKSLNDILVPMVYFIFIVGSYIFSSIKMVKLIPAFISFIFLTFFFYGYINKKKIILSFVERFYKKALNNKNTVKYLASSDFYWVIVLLINTLIQISLIFYYDDTVWAFYSSIGWYLYLFFALLLHVFYEKVFIKSK